MSTTGRAFSIATALLLGALPCSQSGATSYCPGGGQCYDMADTYIYNNDTYCMRYLPGGVYYLGVTGSTSSITRDQLAQSAFNAYLNWYEMSFSHLPSLCRPPVVESTTPDSSGNNKIRVAFIAHALFDANWGTPSSLPLAVTVHTRNSDGTIRYSRTYLDAGANWRLNCADGTCASQGAHDLEGTLTHEQGHGWGLADISPPYTLASCDSTCMWYEAVAGGYFARTIRGPDAAGIRALYCDAGVAVGTSFYAAAGVYGDTLHWEESDIHGSYRYELAMSSTCWGPFAVIDTVHTGDTQCTSDGHFYQYYASAQYQGASYYQLRVLETGELVGASTSRTYGSPRVPAAMPESLWAEPEWVAGSPSLHVRWHVPECAPYTCMTPIRYYVAKYGLAEATCSVTHQVIGPLTSREYVDAATTPGTVTRYRIIAEDGGGGWSISPEFSGCIPVIATLGDTSVTGCPGGDADSVNVMVSILDWCSSPTPPSSGTVYLRRRADSDTTVRVWGGSTGTSDIRDSLTVGTYSANSSIVSGHWPRLSGCGRLSYDLYVGGVVAMRNLVFHVRTVDVDPLALGAIDRFDYASWAAVFFSAHYNECDDFDVPFGTVTSSDGTVIIGHYGCSVPRHVSSPNGGETWITGQGTTVTWQRGYGDSSKVEISAASGTHSWKTLLAHALPDTGRAVLSVPAGLDSCEQCKIEVQHTAGTYQSNVPGIVIGKDASDAAVIMHDGIAPSSVNVQVDAIASHGVFLTWTAPGDDGDAGRAFGYDVRYASQSINGGNFAAASSAPAGLQPLSAGNSEEFELSVPLSCHTYFFALKTVDEVPNISALSNCTSAKTLCGGGGGGAAAMPAPQVASMSANPRVSRAQVGDSDPQSESATLETRVRMGLAIQVVSDPGGLQWKSYWSVDSLDTSRAARSLTWQRHVAGGGWVTSAGVASDTLPATIGIVRCPQPSERLLLRGYQLSAFAPSVRLSVGDSTVGFALSQTSTRLSGPTAAISASPVVLPVGDTLTATYVRCDTIAADAAIWSVLIDASSALLGGTTSPAALLPERQPLAFALLQNRPNPFGQSTSLSFDLPTPSHVRLEIFDMQGRRIRRLAEGPYQAGSWSVDWDGRGDGAQLIRPGVYVYRLEAGRFRSQRKMVLLP